MSYSKSDIERIRKKADIRDFIPGLAGRGASRYCRCPECGKEGKDKGLIATHKANADIAKCFSCGFTLKGAIDAVKYFDKVDFPEAVKRVAEYYNLVIEDADERRARILKEEEKLMKESFCERQLKESGLSFDDVRAEVSGTKGETFQLSPFRKGGFNDAGKIDPNMDEMLIHYYDLWGNPVQYSVTGRNGGTGIRPYIRIRWSNPEIHTDRYGKPAKYMTPKGAPAKFYIPQKIRDKFKMKEPIETLVIQEGEKKAEKACKHGIPSIGIQGIYNIGNAESGLIQDLQYLVRDCAVRNVVLLMDADWDDLRRSLGEMDDIDQRPNQFAKAVIKFQKYVSTLHGIGLYVDVWFAHINKNGWGDKGIDDLLAHTLEGKEEEFRKSFDAAMLDINGKGEYVNVHKISTLTEYQIRDFWQLNDREAFFGKYKEKLKDISRFRFCKTTYTNKEGVFQPLNSTGRDLPDFWQVTYNEKSHENEVKFSILSCFELLEANGFRLIHTSDLEPGKRKMIREEFNVLTEIGEEDCRDFVMNYVWQSTKDPIVRGFFMERLGKLLSSDKLMRLPHVQDDFQAYSPGMQNYFFADKQVRITPDGIDAGSRVSRVWNQNLIRRNFSRKRIIEEITRDESGNFNIRITDEGKKCEFLTYLCNTSNFWHRNQENTTDEDEAQFVQHVVNKITSIGYLLSDYKYLTERKAVVAMDGEIGDVGQSNGRTGKSIVGNAIAQLIEQAEIDGRNLKGDDEYLFSPVTLRTRNIFIDDVNVNFDFGRLYQALTGKMNVNPKTKARFYIENAKSPKIFITTNHAINSDDRSSTQRIIYMVFSDYYSDVRTPYDDFGHALFSDWDDAQWLLFDNFMCECVMYYLRGVRDEWGGSGCGAVPPPMENVQKRTYKQLMGETFLQWAEIYFMRGGKHINCRERRKTMFETYQRENPRDKFTSAGNFRKKLLQYCKYAGLHLNPRQKNKYGENFVDWRQKNPGKSFEGTFDKSSSQEYYTVYDGEGEIRACEEDIFDDD